MASAFYYHGLTIEFDPGNQRLTVDGEVQTTAIPIVPIIQSGEQPFSMFDDLKKYPWVLRRLVSYESAGALKSAMQREVVTPALAMSKVIGDMRRTRFERIEVRNVSARKRDQRRK